MTAFLIILGLIALFLGLMAAACLICLWVSRVEKGEK